MRKAALSFSPPKDSSRFPIPARKRIPRNFLPPLHNPALLALLPFDGRNIHPGSNPADFCQSRTSLRLQKKSAWEARAGEGPDNTAEPPRRGDLRKGPWISPGTGLFNHPWGTGGRAGIWTLDGLAQHGQVHLLPADPRHAFGSFCRVTKGTRPQAEPRFLGRKLGKELSAKLRFASRRL